MKLPKLIWLIAALTGGLFHPMFAGASPWDEPASKLAARIAEILGPGQVQLTIQNLSSVPANDVPAIQAVLQQDLKAHGVGVAETGSANTIRITLSENARQRLWIAEIAQGTDSRVAIVDAGPVAAQPEARAGTLVLRKEWVLTAREPVLAVLETGSELITLEPDQIVFYTRGANGWQEQQRAGIDSQTPLPRDPRGVLTLDSSAVDAWMPGTHCVANQAIAPAPSAWNVECRASDDPWTVSGTPPIRAFYNVARNYFTGVLVPDAGVALPPFYSIATVPSEGGPAVLLGDIDGKVQIIANGALSTVEGTRDWGSDFAALQSGCGGGTQVIVSGSGDAASDSLRAYEVRLSEAAPASEPLDIAGAVTALTTAPDRKSLLAIIHNHQNAYEVDRVTALCN